MEERKIKTLGDALREARERKGISQQQMAEDLGISQSAYSRIEAGGRPPVPDFFETAAILLGDKKKNWDKRIGSPALWSARTWIIGWYKRIADGENFAGMPGLTSARLYGARLTALKYSDLPLSVKIVMWLFAAGFVFDFIRGVMDGAGM